MLEAIEKEFPQVRDVYKNTFDMYLELCEEIRTIYNEMLKRMLASIDSAAKDSIRNGSNFVKTFWKVAHEDRYSKCLLNMNKFFVQKLNEETIHKYMNDDTIDNIVVPLRSVLLFFETSPRTTFDITWDHKYGLDSNNNNRK